MYIAQIAFRFKYTSIDKMEWSFGCLRFLINFFLVSPFQFDKQNKNSVKMYLHEYKSQNHWRSWMYQHQLSITNYQLQFKTIMGNLPVGSDTVWPIFCRKFAGITPGLMICPFGVMNACWLPIWMGWAPFSWFIDAPIFGINSASWPSTVTVCMGCTTWNIPFPAFCKICPPYCIQFQLFTLMFFPWFPSKVATHLDELLRNAL